jgi:2-methylcitrate dehydratase
MDATLASMVAFVTETDLASIPPAAVALTKRHLIDSVACGAGAFRSPTADRIRAAVSGIEEAPGASAYGIAHRLAPEMAAFVNASLNRCLDYNDFGPSGHPSDMMPSQLALAESAGAGGADLIRGIHVAYEIATALADAAPIAEIDWDMGVYYAVAAAGGMASILGLGPEATANAISLAAVPNNPLRVTRSGPASEWRSAATAHACMSALFATRLARAGITGPPEPFEGRHGVFDTVLDAGPIVLGPMARGAAPGALERGALKKHSACFQAQSGVDAALRLSGQCDAADIERITVETSHGTWCYVGGGRGDREERWAPSTREAADHSLPYMVANVFLDGRIDLSTYAPDRLAERRWASLIERIEVRPDPELTDGPQRGMNPARVTVELVDGRVLSELSTFPYDARGRSVVSDDDVKEKFDVMTADVLSPGDAAALHDALTDLESLDDLGVVGRLLRSFGGVPA